MLKRIVHLLLSKLYSKQESGTVARCAMPSSTATMIPSDSGEAVSTYEYHVAFVAPVTGYVSQQVANTINLEDCFSIVSNRTSGVSAQCNSYLKNANRVICPCSKGDSILCTRPLAVPTSDVLIRVSTSFGEVIGGGV